MSSDTTTLATSELSAFQKQIASVILSADPLVRVTSHTYEQTTKAIIPAVEKARRSGVKLILFSFCLAEGRRQIFPSREEDSSYQSYLSQTPKPASGQQAALASIMGPGNPGGTPRSAIEDLRSLAFVKNDKSDRTRIVLLVHDIHLFETDPALKSVLRQFTNHGAAAGKIVIGLTPPGLKMPVELTNAYTVIEHQLPGVAELGAAVADIRVVVGRAASAEPQPLEEAIGEQKLRMIAEAGRGLTTDQFTRIVTQHIAGRQIEQLSPAHVWDAKRAILNEEGFVEAYLPDRRQNFSQLGGYEGVKKFCSTVIGRYRDGKAMRAPKGIVLVGPPGTGKTVFGEHLAAEMDMPLVVIDLSKLFGGLVGDTERNTRRMIELVDELSPCIAVLDELEKMTPGASSGQLDSGVGSRMLSQILTWLSRRRSNAFIIGSANDLNGVHEALTRAERFDGLFWTDLPTSEQRDAIWGIHRTTFKRPVNEQNPTDEQWTGAEIASCVRLADSLGLSLAESAKGIIPYATQHAEQLDNHREKAESRFLCATTGLPFNRDALKAKGNKSAPARRTVVASSKNDK